MSTNIFQGEMVRLVSEDSDVVADHFSRWSRDTEYWSLQAANPSILYSVKKREGLLEKGLLMERADMFFFMIRTLEGDRLIGEMGLEGVQWSHGDTFVGISIGEREYWGKGYGTDAMRVILRYAFIELNLHRVSLNVFEYNQRAIRSYEKVGFIYEGRVRQFLKRFGQRWDLIHMGILREQWEKEQRL